MKNTVREIIKNESTNGTIFRVTHSTSKSLDTINNELNTRDLLPQATDFACSILNEILTYGRADYSKCIKMARELSINIESVLLRLPMLQITPKDCEHDHSSPVSIELSSEIVVDPHSPSLITIPCWEKDTILNVGDRSKDLYLIYGSTPAKHLKVNFDQPELVDRFYQEFLNATKPADIRLALLSQAIFFTPNEGLEKFRHDVVYILHEYHANVNPIDMYFQSFTKTPTLGGLGECLGENFRSPLKQFK